MKVVILAGGLGTRLSEETINKPKPLVEIGDMPIIWHIMKIYSHFGLNDFIICLGYKGYMIKEFFANYALHTSDVTIDISKNQITTQKKHSEPWKITLVDTGKDTMTGGRIRRVKDYLDNEDFCLTYGDGVADININKLIDFHKNQKTLATITAVKPPGRFGALKLENNIVSSFDEKPEGDGNWINGGFFVLSPRIIDFIQDDTTVLERSPLERIALEKQLSAFKHDSFWQPVDTLRDKEKLDKIWNSGNAPWKVW